MTNNISDPSENVNSQDRTGLILQTPVDHTGHTNGNGSHAPVVVVDQAVVWKEILSHLWRGGEFGNYWSLPKSKTIWISTGNLQIPDLSKTDLKDIYFGVHPSRQIPTTNAAGVVTEPAKLRSQAEHIAAINCMVGDFDAKDEITEAEYSQHLPANFADLTPTKQKSAIKTARETELGVNLEVYKARCKALIDALEIQPSLIIFTGGGFHCYWFLREQMLINADNRADVEFVLRAWAATVGCDLTCADLPRVLRPVGSINGKDHLKRPIAEIVIYDPALLYDYSFFENLAGENDEEKKQTQKSDAAAEKREKSGDNLKKDPKGIISKFNAKHQHTMVDYLVEKMGCLITFNLSNRARLARNGRKKSQPSITVYKNNDKAWRARSWSSSNTDLGDKFAHDFFSLFTIFDHKGDGSAAFKAAAIDLELWEEPWVKIEKKQSKLDLQTGEMAMSTEEIEAAHALAAHLENDDQGDDDQGDDDQGDVGDADVGQSIPEKPALKKLSETEHLTDLGNGMRMARLQGNNLRYTEATGWLVWDGKRWDRDETGKVKRIAKRTALSFYDDAADALNQAREAAADAAKCAAAGQDEKRDELLAIQTKLTKWAQALQGWALKCESRDKISAMIEMAQSEHPIPIRARELDQDPWLFNTENGTINLQTGELMAHRRTDMLTKMTPVLFDPTIQCPLWLKFLDRIFKSDKDLIAFMQRAVGLSLTGISREHHLFFAFGNGQNGKSTFFNVVTKMLGDYFLKCPTETLMAKERGSGIPNDIARMAGARMILAAEVEAGSRLAEAKVKDLTGGDRLTARFLNKEYFDFDPTHKLWMYGNHKPVIRGTDTGIWRRVLLIPFTTSIPESEKDPNLTGKLLEELPGILMWAIQGCLDWQKNGLKPPQLVLDATNQYKDESDVMATFLEECTTNDMFEGKNPSSKASEIYKIYKRWAELGNIPPLNQTRFGMQIRERGIEAEINKSTKVTWYQGIGINDTWVKENMKLEPIQSKLL